MDEKLKEQQTELTEDIVNKDTVDSSEESADKPKKEYTDPNENVFRTGPNTGTEESAGSYNYGQNSNNNYSGYTYQNNNSAQNGQQNFYTQYNRPQWDNEPLSFGEWVLTLLIAMVPCVGLVIYCVWAFGSSGNVNRRNFCRAYLVIEAVGLILAFFLAMFTAMIGIFSTF